MGAPDQAVAAPRPAARGRVNARPVRENTLRLLTNGRYRDDGLRIGETFRTARGVARAADEVEALLRKNTTTRVDKPGGMT